MSVHVGVGSSGVEPKATSVVTFGIIVRPGRTHRYGPACSGRVLGLVARQRAGTAGLDEQKGGAQSDWQPPCRRSLPRPHSRRRRSHRRRSSPAPPAPVLKRAKDLFADVAAVRAETSVHGEVEVAHADCLVTTEAVVGEVPAGAQIAALVV